MRGEVAQTLGPRINDQKDSTGYLKELRVASVWPSTKFRSITLDNWTEFEARDWQVDNILKSIAETDNPNRRLL